ncbi:MAG: hypoxanthine-guanine phosphoribosyltransferase [Methylococcaceae bacterium]|nr:hypoxanthine-guanine phosphoribosyltransferase [Methylococcaceae bacterium]
MPTLNEIFQIQASADCLYTESEVESAIDNMAEKINLFLKATNPVILCVMNGGVVITGKLLTQLNFPFTFDAINASRYLNQTSGGDIHWKQKPETDLKNRTVLIIDDILDQGQTLEAIINYCKDHAAKSIYTAVLVDKKLTHQKPVTADFIGLEVENRYLFGYGMDYKGYLRNASGIYACKED